MIRIRFLAGVFLLLFSGVVRKTRQWTVACKKREYIATNLIFDTAVKVLVYLYTCVLLHVLAGDSEPHHLVDDRKARLIPSMVCLYFIFYLGEANYKCVEGLSTNSEAPLSPNSITYNNYLLTDIFCKFQNSSNWESFSSLAADGVGEYSPALVEITQ